MKNFYRFVISAMVAMVFFQSQVFAQVGINTDGSAADNSAALDVKSTTKGFLVPRMTQAEIGAIASPADGLLVFCTSNNKFFCFLSNLNKWMEIAYGSTTISPGGFSCGDPLIINHTTAGGVAPVNKMTTYGTVLGITGEPSKCWITSNLGSDHQATAVNDATEASAGWYWQFNKKQGYKHDGVTRTPNSTWITSISENSDWVISNDPCALEFGTGWRIPTNTEWTNVDASGSWTDWNGPWNSGLKLHAGGCLNEGDGSWIYRGIEGHMWSTHSNNNTGGSDLFFSSSSSYLPNDPKSRACSLRCIRD